MTSETLILKNIKPAPVGGFSKYNKNENVISLPLNVGEIRKLYFDGLITLEESVQLIYDWRYFNIRAVHKKIDKEPEDATYIYCTLPKRGNKKSVLNTWNHGLRQKLFSRGITEDSIVRVISSYGLITFEIGRKTFAIGRGMAQKISVIKVI